MCDYIWPNPESAAIAGVDRFFEEYSPEAGQLVMARDIFMLGGVLFPECKCRTVTDWGTWYTYEKKFRSAAQEHLFKRTGTMPKTVPGKGWVLLRPDDVAPMFLHEATKMSRAVFERSMHKAASPDETCLTDVGRARKTVSLGYGRLALSLLRTLEPALHSLAHAPSTDTLGVLAV